MSGLKEFELFVLDKCKEWKINAEDLYFSQGRNGYYADYRPSYPEKTNGDFTVTENILTGERKIYGNFGSLTPTIKAL